MPWTLSKQRKDGYEWWSRRIGLYWLDVARDPGESTWRWAVTCQDQILCESMPNVSRRETAQRQAERALKLELTRAFRALAA